MRYVYITKDRQDVKKYFGSQKRAEDDMVDLCGFDDPNKWSGLPESVWRKRMRKGLDKAGFWDKSYYSSYCRISKEELY